MAYDKSPKVELPHLAGHACSGWKNVASRIGEAWTSLDPGDPILAIDCYGGVFEDEIIEQLTQHLTIDEVIRTNHLMKPADEIRAMIEPALTDDPVFGQLSLLRIDAYWDQAKMDAARQTLVQQNKGRVLIIGPGAADVAEPDLLIYADLARWEWQLRSRKDRIANLGLENFEERPSLQYKCGFFVDWRVLDRHKKKTMARWDFLLDTNIEGEPRLVTGEALREGLRRSARRPFRVVPFFDPAPWGGQWMKEVCDLPREADNYGWCFDCVPEENSLLLDYDGVTVEIPSINVVFFQPVELLGHGVHARFGTEFPIRTDFLDTMGGGNLSFQVHPLTEYIQDNFGMHYTQDESYYLLDAGDDATVYLGVKPETDPGEMIADLEAADRGEKPFDADRFANRFPAKKHDHFLIPAGTVHCSGANAMVYEISATPYIFTFKLWDWGRLGLDGRPRPTHIHHGKHVIQYGRDTAWVERNLINRIDPIAEGEGWRRERTGLHEREFLESERTWFRTTVEFDTEGNLNVLNLVEGEAVVIESPERRFEPFELHYAETVIIPAAVGPYTIRPVDPSREHGVVRIYVRP